MMENNRQAVLILIRAYHHILNSDWSQEIRWAACQKLFEICALKFGRYSMAATEFHYEFEKDEGFMRFLREFNPDWPEWWECEYSGDLKGMYQAYLCGMKDGATAVRLEVESQLTRRSL